MKKIILILIGLLYLTNNCLAQLNKLCPISSTVYNKQKAEGMNLLLNTKDFTPYLVQNGKTLRTSTLQLVRANNPFPPLWFQMGNPEADTGSFIGTTFLGDVRIQKDNKKLTFFGSYPGKFFGATTLDIQTLQPIDSLTKYSWPTKDNVIMQLDSHDYQVDADGNQLFANQVKQKVDARCLSGLEKDSVRYAVVNNIVILNAKDSVIFYWNPLEHMSVCEMNWAYRNSSLTYGEMINWSHLNSVRFANDGNIIYSYRHIGLGKINVKTGEIMWKLGGKDIEKSISLPDSARYYLQHDFSQGEDGLYYVFSNGDEAHPYAEGMVYKIDELSKRATLVDHYKPRPEIYSLALGGYECKEDNCVICIGMYKTAAKETQLIGQILKKKIVTTDLYAPLNNFAYQIHQTKWDASQLRPKVTQKNNVLKSNSLNGLDNYTWYKIEGTSAIPVGTGKTLSPVTSGKYVVEAQQGTGLFRSYLISDVFEFKKKK